jgi:hypothetical protein
MSHRKMWGVPMMDNADGQMLQTGLNRGNSALSCRVHDGKRSGAESRFLVFAAARGGITPWPNGPTTGS